MEPVIERTLRRGRETLAAVNDVERLYLRDWMDVVFIYAISGFVGTLHETCWTLLSKGVFEDRSGSILSPFNYVYGLGALAIFFALRGLRKGHQVFIVGALLGGVLEYSMSVIQQYLLGSRSWDYSQLPLNIGGRTTVPFMLFWGLLCFVIVRWILPLMLHVVHAIDDDHRRTIAVILLAWIAVDYCVTLPAIFLYAQRADGFSGGGWFADVINTVFNDAFMRRHFPNMRV
ncbi:hypothetical protein BLEM_2115 [Bifidobacterium lemurum]|uniref:ABC transporter permease n=1 Tax=Bifidobacterium lemurum TaxID=1603886 RepID=A0A261FL79_9BIFI|nr:putative ABC transporter permease [Bifidobacterium lemurum]OZG59940.1 hypothetical protein BLEM_2115 [Bifidobacterium lemurum]